VLSNPERHAGCKACIRYKDRSRSRQTTKTIPAGKVSIFEFEPFAEHRESTQGARPAQGLLDKAAGSHLVASFVRKQCLL
jgi:hypothetical protein